jgi:hypothetical protein
MNYKFCWYIVAFFVTPSVLSTYILSGRENNLQPYEIHRNVTGLEGLIFTLLDETRKDKRSENKLSSTMGISILEHIPNSICS